MHDDPTRLRAYLALAIGIIGLGFSAIFVKAADAPGVISSLYRMGIAGVVFAIPLALQRRNGPLSRRGILLAVLAGLFFGADMYFWSEGIVISGATNPTLMANTAPAWVGLGALLFFREKLNARFWIGLLIALLGAAIVIGADSLRHVDFGQGTVYGLIAGMFYGGFFLVAQRGRSRMDTLSFFWFSVLGSTVLLLAVALLKGAPLTGYSTETYLYFLAAGIISQVIAWYAINYAQGHLPATAVSPSLLGQPVMTALLAVAFLGEGLSGWQIVGGLAILGGIYIVHRARLNGPPKEQQ